MATSGAVKELFVLLGVETDEADFRKAEDALDSVESVARRLALAAAAAGAALAASAILAARSGDRYAKTAQQVGLTAEEVQELTIAAEASGATFEQFRIGILKVQQRQAEAARGNKEYAKEFRRLGIDVTDANGRLRSGRDIFYEVAAAIAAIPEPGERARVAMRLFEEGGAALLPLFAGLKGGIGDLAREARDLGYIMSNEQAEAAEKATFNLQRLKMAGVGLQRQVGVGLFPIIDKVASRTVDWLTANRDLIRGGIDRLTRFVGVLADKLLVVFDIAGRVLTNLHLLRQAIIPLTLAIGIVFAQSIGTAIASLVLMIPKLYLAAEGFLVMRGAALASWAAIGIAVLFVAGVIDDVMTHLRGGESLVGDFIEAFDPRRFDPNDHWIVKALRLFILSVEKGAELASLLWTAFTEDGPIAQKAKRDLLNFWNDIFREWGADIQNFMESTPLIGDLLKRSFSAPTRSADDLIANTGIGEGRFSIYGGRVNTPRFRQVQLTQSTEIKVDGVGDPLAVADAVAARQIEVNAAAVREAQRELE